MKLNIDFQEWRDFGNRLSNMVEFEERMARLTQKIAEELHDMLITETPVEFGALKDCWKTQENYAYFVERKKNGFEVTLVNRLEYATWVNDGHKQRPGRFIPGYWIGNHFIYDPSADEGMVLKKPWVQGRFFVETSVLKLENSDVIESLIRVELDKWFRWCVDGK